MRRFCTQYSSSYLLVSESSDLDSQAPASSTKLPVFLRPFSRDGDVVEVFNMGLDFTCGNAAGIHGYDLVIEVAPPNLLLTDELGIKPAFTIQRDVDGDLFPSFSILSSLAVATITGAIAFPSVFLISEITGELRLQDTRLNLLLQLLGQAGLTERFSASTPSLRSL
jgi:hypothetical protein